MRAPVEGGETGKVPIGPGWFVVNAFETEWMEHEKFGLGCTFEGRTRFEQLGFNLRVLQPGQPNCLYHRELDQENFLVLSGQCVAIVDDQEVPLKAWDFFHCPPGTDHVFVGAGEEPCVILMVGRRSGGGLTFPVSEVAARYGASVERETRDASEAYAAYERPLLVPAPPDLKLPS